MNVFLIIAGTLNAIVAILHLVGLKQQWANL